MDETKYGMFNDLLLAAINGTDSRNFRRAWLILSALRGPDLVAFYNMHDENAGIEQAYNTWWSTAAQLKREYVEVLRRWAVGDKYDPHVDIAWGSVDADTLHKTLKELHACGFDKRPYSHFVSHLCDAYESAIALEEDAQRDAVNEAK